MVMVPPSWAWRSEWAVASTPKSHPRKRLAPSAAAPVGRDSRTTAPAPSPKSTAVARSPGSTTVVITSLPITRTRDTTPDSSTE